MDFIKFSTSMTMLDLVQYLVQDTNYSFAFYNGKLPTGNKINIFTDSKLVTMCLYICQRVREEWNVFNIGIIGAEDSEVMVCVTSSDPRMPSDVISFMVEALGVVASCLGYDQYDAAERSASEDSMEQDIPPDLIQVNATMKEVRERIEQFLRYKRTQADANNVRDFCGTTDQAQFCARVDAILVRKKDSSSHMAVRNVLDRYTAKHNQEASQPTTLTTTPVMSNVTPLESLAKIEKRNCDENSIDVLRNKIFKYQKS